jgi:hypothetical protein
VPSHQLLLQRRNRCLKLLDLRGEYLQHRTRESRHTLVILIAHKRDQLANVPQPLRRNDSEFREVRPQGIHQRVR